MENTSKKSGLIITPRITRRDLLMGMAAAGGVAAITSLGYKTISSKEEDTTQTMVPFYGIHQAGIINPSPAAGLIVSFDVLGKNKQDLTRLFKILTTRVEFLTKGGKIPQQLNPKLPPINSGVMGDRIYPDNLTVTAAVGASIFDDRFGLSKSKPVHLVNMPAFPNDALDADRCHGDLLLQFCSNTAETNIHALRDIIKNLPDLISLRWQLDGFLPPHTLKKPGESVRNLLGFKDGTANINATDNKLMDKLTWVQPKSAEPAWAVGGTYQVVRIIRNKVEFWDRTPLKEQQEIIGRDKYTGAPLGMKNEKDIPQYKKDPEGKTILKNAHIRLANPRESDLGLILRRGFNYSRGYSKAGQLDMGLLFVCFQADLERGFITVQNRLNGEPLEEYIKPVGGGYFFALPGVKDSGSYLGKALIES
jgi:deferrochelatase/peroxidase EfeB